MAMYDDLEPENDAEKKLIEAAAKGEWYFGPGASEKKGAATAARLIPRCPENDSWPCPSRRPPKLKFGGLLRTRMKR